MLSPGSEKWIGAYRCALSRERRRRKRVRIPRNAVTVLAERLATMPLGPRPWEGGGRVGCLSQDTCLYATHKKVSPSRVSAGIRVLSCCTLTGTAFLYIPFWSSTSLFARGEGPRLPARSRRLEGVGPCTDGCAWVRLAVGLRASPVQEARGRFLSSQRQKILQKGRSGA